MRKFVAFIFLSLMLLTATCLAAKPIIVLGARDAEVSALIEKLEKPKYNIIAGNDYASGKIDSYPVIVIKTHIGMVNAASTVTAAIERFNPLFVVSSGTAGAHDKKLKIGDIVLCSKLCNTNCYASEYSAPGTGIHPEKWEIQDSEVFINNDWQQIRYLYSDPELINTAKNVTYKQGNVVTGITSSGDVWNRECDYIHYLHEKFGTSCEEMESFAVASVCSKYSIPFLGVRVICNSEDNGQQHSAEVTFSQDYYTDAAKYGQEFVYDMLKLMIAKKVKSK